MKRTSICGDAERGLMRGCSALPITTLRARGLNPAAFDTFRPSASADVPPTRVSLRPACHRCFEDGDKPIELFVDLAEMIGHVFSGVGHAAIILAPRACRWVREKISLHPPSCCLSIVSHRPFSAALLPPEAWS
jgi:hypothetical protein